MKISKDAATGIARRAIAARLKPEADSLAKAEDALGRKCWKAVHSQDAVKWAAKAPDGWLRLDKCLRFNCGGWNVLLTLIEGVPVPYSSGCSRQGVIPDDMTAEVKEFVQKRDDFQKHRKTLESDLYRTILSCGSFKRLLDNWPEGREYYAAHLVISEGPRSLAVPFSELNAKLGLHVAEAA